jgi:hypothetical protein
MITLVTDAQAKAVRFDTDTSGLTLKIADCWEYLEPISRICAMLLRRKERISLLAGAGKVFNGTILTKIFLFLSC